MRGRIGLALSGLLLATAASAQQPTNPPRASPAAPVPGANAPVVGTLAPDFTIKGATRFGVIRDPMKLSDFRGQTVVLWLFIKARTRG